MKKLICVFISVAMIFAFAGCGKEKTEDNNEPVINQEEESSHIETTVPETTTEMTTEATTVPETTTAPDGSSIKHIVDTLESKQFYLAGTINLTGGESMEAKMSCDGDDSKMDISSARMKMSMIYLDGTAYIVNTSTNTYAVFDETAVDSLDQMLGSMSSYGISFSSTDITEMENMMKDFDTSMDFSQYIENGEYSEFTVTNNGSEYLVSEYATEYGKIRIYTQEGQLKTIDIFDTEGLRQMNFVVSAFIPQVLAPISLNGLTLTNSILNLFTGL
ncbi:MAG: hypothetical protein IKV76_01320 [Clostridia bacterium]|nr:hypothetical protein [Clostridia bacterium]